MVVTCSVCRDVVHTSGGYILRHFIKGHHMPRVICSGSGMSVVSDCCDLNIGVRD